MYSYSPCKTSLRRMLVASILVILLMASCSTNAQPPAASTRSTQDDLLVRLNGPFQCHLDSLSNLPGALVLAGTQMTFDDATIHQLGQYVSESVSIAAPPGDFHILALAEIGNSYAGGGDCQWSLQITNRGEATIEMEQVQMQLHAVSQQVVYHLIDICSLPLTHPIACPPQGRGGTPVNYTYQFDLGDTDTDRLLTGQLGGSFNPTLNTGDTVEIQALFTLPKTAKRMAYQVTPVLTVDRPGRKLTQAITQESQAMAIVTMSQLDCYTLEGYTFIRLPSLIGKTIWCL